MILIRAAGLFILTAVAEILGCHRMGIIVLGHRSTP